MEIGVARGHGAEVMIQEARKAGVNEIEYFGFDTFEGVPDDEPQTGSPTDIEKVKKILTNLKVKYHLFKGNTRETLPRVVPTLPKMDFIYIDGGHSEKTVRSDWQNVQSLMHNGTVVVFDDYGLIEPPLRGITRVVNEIGNDRRYVLKFIPAPSLSTPSVSLVSALRKKQAIVKLRG